MIVRIMVGIAVGVVGTLLAWSTKSLKETVSRRLDRQKVYVWLEPNTRDELGESHRDLRTLSTNASISSWTRKGMESWSV